MCDTYPLKLISSAPDIRAVVSFPADFPAFQGHFPGAPVLPGFMHVQLALDSLRAAGLACRLKEIRVGKFTAPILPGVSITAALVPQAANCYQVTLSGDDTTFSTFTLTVE